MSRLLFHASLALRIPSLFDEFERNKFYVVHIRRYYTWTDHYLHAVICRSRSGLSANKREEKLRRMIIIVQLVKIDCRSRIAKLGDCLYVRLITKRWQKETGWKRIQSLLQLFLFFKKVDVRKLSQEELQVTAKTYSTLKIFGEYSTVQLVGSIIWIMLSFSFFSCFLRILRTVELTVCRKCSPVFNCHCFPRIIRPIFSLKISLLSRFVVYSFVRWLGHQENQAPSDQWWVVNIIIP